MQGFVHSVESLGTVDGPGIRYVVFLQGCPMRCLYCHNPDTWAPNKGTQMSPEQIVSECERYRPYLKKGGLTITGGEPLLQLEFVIQTFSLAKERGFHTCLDTSGILFEDNEAFARLCEVTDLVLLDIKHMDDAKHRKLTGHSNENVFAFAHYLDDKHVPVWIRHVVVPGITFDENELLKLGNFIGSLRNVKAIDVLPYHDLGKSKYEKLGLDYPLADTPPLTKDEAIWARNKVLEGYKMARS